MVELEPRVLFQSPLVTVTDVRCRAADRRCGQEEVAPFAASDPGTGPRRLSSGPFPFRRGRRTR
jgi:hypothetical protein